MKDLRERAENLFGRGGKFSFWGNPGREQAIKDVEAEFREIRNEALEEAASIIRDWNTSWYNEDMKLEAQRHDREMRIRALKTDALANSVSKDTEVKGQ